MAAKIWSRIIFRDRRCDLEPLRFESFICISVQNDSTAVKTGENETVFPSAAAMDSGESLHIFFLPLITPGHMLPMVDMAKLFAERGVKATLVTTPRNAARLRDSVELANAGAGAGAGVQVLPVEFPPLLAGLPDDDSPAAPPATSPELPDDFFQALATLREPFEQLVEEHEPDCIISDSSYPWTSDVADEFGIPRLVFHGCSAFALAVMERLLRTRAPHQGAPDEGAAAFAVPDLPDRIATARSRLPKYLLSPPNYFEQIKASYLKSCGMVVNSFRELEPAGYNIEACTVGHRSWYIGPLSLCNRLDADKAVRGREKASSGDGVERCFAWLDAQAPRSVLYVCFGSLCRFTGPQLCEIAEGLEASGHPFLWVLRDVDGAAKGGATALPEGFEEKTEGRGRMLRGWAPQLLILGHVAVGGFMTHCGWNSTLEAISAGTPMVAWPLFSEQFINEKFIVQVLRVGVAVGATVCSLKDEERAVVGKERVEAAVTLVMGGGQEAEGMRRRARDLAAMAKRAVEAGGSSHRSMDDLIQELLGVKKWR